MKKKERVEERKTERMKDRKNERQKEREIGRDQLLDGVAELAAAETAGSVPV